MLGNDVTVRLFTLSDLPRDFFIETIPISARSFDKLILIDMPGRKENVADKAVAHQGDAPVRASKLPRRIQFPLVVLLSLSTSALFYSFAAKYTAGELATVSRSLNEWWEVGALVGWRA